MPKIKPPVRTPHIDMTPMVDLFSVLLIFLLLTASFRPQEAAVITTPQSVSEKTAPDADLMTIFISKDGKVYFNFDNGRDTSTHFRSKLLEKMGEQYKIQFTKAEIAKFGTCKNGSIRRKPKRRTNCKQASPWIQQITSLHGGFVKPV